MIFDILFVLSYFIYFDRMELSPKIKFTYLLTNNDPERYCGNETNRTVTSESEMGITYSLIINS